MRKPQPTTSQMAKKLEAIRLKLGMSQGCLLSTLLYNTALEVLAGAVRQERKLKDTDRKRS